MHTTCPVPFICPVCRQPLARAERAFHCPAGHHFDMARQGYVNLLLGKRPKIQGDSQQMLLARERFLQAGHYRPLVDALVQAIAPMATDTKDALTLLDVGCGTGFYLRRLRQRLSSPLCRVGVDLSKEAAKLTARLDPETAVAVADVKKLLPVADDSVDVLLNIFAPRQPQAFARVLAPGGWLIVVIPAPEHLQNVRERFSFMNIEANKETAVRQQMASLFTLGAAQRVQASLKLSGSELADLAQMTPSGHHLAPVDLTRLAQRAEVTTTAVFHVLTFQCRR